MPNDVPTRVKRMKYRRKAKRFRRPFVVSPLLAFGGGLDTIEGMSPGRRAVNYASVLIVFALAVGEPALARRREIPANLPPAAWASAVLGDLPEGFVVAP